MDADDRSLTYPFLVDLSAAGFNDTMITYDSPAAGNVSIGAIGADPASAQIFDPSFTPVNDGDYADSLAVYAFQDSLFWGALAGGTEDSPNSDPQDLTAAWNNPLGPVTNAGPDSTALTVEPEYPYQYLLTYSDTNQEWSTTVIYSADVVTVDPTLPLDFDGSWLLSNIDLSDGYTAGTDGYEMIISNSEYTLIYTGPSYYGNFSYGTVDSYDTGSGYMVIQQTDDNLDPSANGQYFKETYTINSGELSITCFEGKDTATEAVNSNTVIWGPSAGMTAVTNTVPEITGVWAGADEGGQIEYAFTPTKIGFERFDDFAFGAGTGGGDIISVDNDTNTIIFQMKRHSLDGTQVDQYFKLTYTHSSMVPVNGKGNEIAITLYGPHLTQVDAENDTTIDGAEHTVVRQ
jgi:hypothetical protein